MQTCLECLPCIVKQSLETIDRTISNLHKRESALREVLKRLSIHHWHLSPPYLAHKAHRIIGGWSGLADPYREVKARFNRIAMEMLPGLRERVRQAADPFAMALRIAMAGNIIDVGIVPDLSERKLADTIEHALSAPLAIDDLAALREASAQAERILFLGDNAGEIVFDRLILEQLPMEKVTFAVRGRPILNDATMEDAEATGLTRLVRVIDSGIDIPGTIPEMCSAAFRAAYAQADLIIAKGQGNYETLSDAPHPSLYFLLKVKCPMVAAQLGVPMGSLVAKRKQTACPAEART